MFILSTEKFNNFKYIDLIWNSTKFSCYNILCWFYQIFYINNIIMQFVNKEGCIHPFQYECFLFLFPALLHWLKPPI